MIIVFFFFTDTSITEIYTLSLHDALPISLSSMKSLMVHLSTFHQNFMVESAIGEVARKARDSPQGALGNDGRDRKSTRLNSSHSQISYAVFCLKKKISR